MNPDEMRDYIERRQWLNYNEPAQELEVELCRRNPMHWLSAWVYTLDPDDPVNPIKQFPIKPYTPELVRLFVEEPLLLLVKSRQMMISWFMAAMCLWEAQFNYGRFTFYQSKKEADADALVQRSLFIYNRQPKWMRPKAKVAYCKLSFPERHSQIWGIPQGADQIRMHTASRIWIDEAAFQPLLPDSYTAAKPCLNRGGRLVLTSSIELSFFNELLEDRVVMAR